MKYSLIVDGMLSGTGVRDYTSGGYIDLQDIGLSDDLTGKVNEWLQEYENAHYFQFEDQSINASLDERGMQIAQMIKSELPDIEIRYYSASQLREMDLP